MYRHNFFIDDKKWLETIFVSKEGEIQLTNERKLPVSNLLARSISNEMKSKKKIEKRDKKDSAKKINLAICAEINKPEINQKSYTDVPKNIPRITNDKVLAEKEEITINKKIICIKPEMENNQSKMVTRGRLAKENKAMNAVTGCDGKVMGKTKSKEIRKLNKPENETKEDKQKLKGNAIEKVKLKPIINVSERVQIKSKNKLNENVQQQKSKESEKSSACTSLREKRDEKPKQNLNPNAKLQPIETHKQKPENKTKKDEQKLKENAKK